MHAFNLTQWALQNGFLLGNEQLDYPYKIGLIDAFLNLNTDNIRTAHIHVRSFNHTVWETRSQRNEHGNLMMSLICGQPHTAFTGLFPEAQVYFSNAIKNKDPINNAKALSLAIDWMIQCDVAVILFPFGLLHRFTCVEQAIERAAKRSIMLVAAAGNHGQERPFYPACHPQVIAVTATDVNGYALPSCIHPHYVNVSIRAASVPSYSDSGLCRVFGTSSACVLWALLNIAQHNRQ